jgi:hypothetical protein
VKPSHESRRSPMPARCVPRCVPRGRKGAD